MAQFQETSAAGLCVLLFLLGLLMELAQGSLPHRSADFGDLMANSAGIAAGWTLAVAGLGNWCVWVERRIGLQHA